MAEAFRCWEDTADPELSLQSPRGHPSLLSALQKQCAPERGTVMKLKYTFLTILACAIASGGAAAQSAQQPGTVYPENAPTPGNAYPGTQQPGVYQRSQTAAPATTQAATIPAGTQLSIRTNETINATSADVGRQYAAEIVQPVTDQAGNVLIPQGSQATLSIASASSGILGVGSNQVALALQSINANGRAYTVQTNQVQQQGKQGIGANKRTAEMTGGGAVLGTLLGALAGGGKGAAIGAVVGGAGGATAQVLTRGKQVSVPAESVLNFRLDEPITLQ